MIILEGYEHVVGTMETDKVSVDTVTGEVLKETIDFNNYVLYYRSNERSRDDPTKGVVGWFCDNVKAKADQLRIIGAETLAECIGHEVMLGFDMAQRADRNGKMRASVTSIVLLDGGAKK